MQLTRFAASSCGRIADSICMGYIRMRIRIGALARKLRWSHQGSVAIQMGLLAAVLIGMAALAVDIGFAIYKHRQMQSAADAAAFGAATALATGHPADFRTEACALAAAVGYVNGVDGVVITVNHPPVSPPASAAHAADPTAVQVIITQPQTLILVGLFGSGIFKLGVSAVALQGNAGLYCVFALDPTASAAVYLNNNAAVNACGVGANSNSNSALTLNNNALITGPVSVVGKWSLANNARLTGTPQKQNAAAMTDPYAGVPLQPPPGPCTNPPASASTVHILNPTGEVHLCRLNYSNNVTLNLDPGAYYIDTQLSLQNNVTVNGTGVTLIINGNYAMSLGNNLTMNLTAPTSGEYTGLVFASPRTATSTSTQRFSNNTILNLNGAVYFPNQILQFDNNATLNARTCGQLIARKIAIYNNATLGSQCAVPIGGSASRLVE